MRDLLILAIFVAGLVYALRDPFVGLMVYTWISVMNPHRYAWGFAYDMPLALGSAAVTLVSMVLHTDQLRFPRVRETYLFLTIWLWITVTTQLAFYPANAWIVWQVVAKIFLMVAVTMVLVNTRTRLLIYVVGLVFFIGFVSVKGALFGILTRGQFRVWGPEDSFIGDNNSAALAMVMILPFCFFLRSVVTSKWLSRALLVVGLSSIVSILLTYSRGGLLGVAAVGAVSILYSKHKIRVGLAAATLVFIGLSLLPAAWMARMNTIENYEEDASANMRLNSWQMSWHLAKAHPIGGGFDCFTMEQYYKYAPDPELGRVPGGASTAHSIYFEVLAMHGFPGLAIYLTCLISVLFSMNRVRRTAQDAGMENVTAYTRAFTVSVVGFMVCGAFQSRAFFDLFWSIFAAAVCLKSMVLSGTWQRAPVPETAGPRPTAGDRTATVRTLARHSWRGRDSAPSRSESR